MTLINIQGENSYIISPPKQNSSLLTLTLLNTQCNPKSLFLKSLNYVSFSIKDGHMWVKHLHMLINSVSLC